MDCFLLIFTVLSNISFLYVKIGFKTVPFTLYPLGAHGAPQGPRGGAMRPIEGLQISCCKLEPLQIRGQILRAFTSHGGALRGPKNLKNGIWLGKDSQIDYLSTQLVGQ